MRVLHVIDSLSFGGAERLLATLARAAPGADLDLSVASLQGPRGGTDAMAPTLARAGIEAGFIGVRRLGDPSAPRRVARAIRASGCDVVHAHLQYSSILLPALARPTGVPVVCTLHQVPFDLHGRESFKQWLAVRSGSRAAALVFVSRASRQGFAARYRSRESWTVVPNGVDLEEFSPAERSLPPGLGVAPGAPVVALVAAMRGDKGHRQAIAAWPAVVAAMAGARLLFVGTGPDESALRRLAAGAGVGDSVVFAGMREDVADILRAANVVLLPSRVEAYPTVLMEAAACAKPVVATAVGGVPEVVATGETGVLVPLDEPRRLAGAVVDLLADPGAARVMGKAARRRAEQRFGSVLWARRLASVYAGAVAGRSSPGETVA